MAMFQFCLPMLSQQKAAAGVENIGDGFSQWA